jgi:hypothetical protein
MLYSFDKKPRKMAYSCVSISVTRTIILVTDNETLRQCYQHSGAGSQKKESYCDQREYSLRKYR